MRNKYISEIVDYILDTEAEDFFENLEEFELSTYEIKLLTDWHNDDIGISKEVKQIFKKLGTNNHIYTSAICLAYGIE